MPPRKGGTASMPTFSATRKNKFNQQMNYLSQAKILSENSSVKGQIIEFENEAGISLPPVFKAFVMNYDISTFTISIFNTLFFPEKNSYSHFEKTEFIENPEVSFESLLSPSEYLKAKTNVYHYEEDEEIIRDKIVIGNIHGGTLLLGYKEFNSDIIYADFISEDERLVKVGENILDYFRKIKIEVDEDILTHVKVKKSDLYKKWEENFWRFG